MALSSQGKEPPQNPGRFNLNIQPTLEIRPGYRFNIRVNKDMLFAGPYKDMPPLSR